MSNNWVQLSSIPRSSAIGRMVRCQEQGRQGAILYFLSGDFQRVAIQTGTGPVVLVVSECQVQAEQIRTGVSVSKALEEYGA